MKKWVKEQVAERNKKLAVDKGVMIEMDPELAEAFHASTKVSGKCRRRFFAAEHIFPQSNTASASTC